MPNANQAQTTSPAESIDLSNGAEEGGFEPELASAEPLLSDDEYGGVRPVLSRHNSDVSLASRALSQEEGRMHRFGQKFRRDILRPEGEDHEHGTTGLEEQPRDLKLLRAMIEGLGGDELRRRIESEGQENVLEDLANEASMLRQEFIQQDPEGWKKFEESMEAAQRNSDVAGLHRSYSVIE